jgi:hypothetical protein
MIPKHSQRTPLLFGSGSLPHPLVGTITKYVIPTAPSAMLRRAQVALGSGLIHPPFVVHESLATRRLSTPATILPSTIEGRNPGSHHFD